MGAKRAAGLSTDRKAVIGLMTIGTLICVASLFGPDWMIRAGLVVALIMAFSAVAFSWHELDVVRRAHMVELSEIRQAMLAAATKHHEESLDMIDRFNARTTQLGVLIAKLRAELSSARGELATLRGNSAWLRAEVTERQTTIDLLNQRISELEAELSVAQQEESAEILAMPRYGVASTRGSLPSADELWPDGDFPTMVDLTAVPFPTESEQRKQA